MNFRMKMLEVHRGQLRGLLADMTREQACFLICHTAQGRDEVILLVNEVVPIHPEHLLVHKPDQLSVDPDAMLKVARRAARSGGSVCMVHTHPMSAGHVQFSRADDIGNVATFGFFSRMLPRQPNSCLVFDSDLACVAGRVYTSENEWFPIASVEVVDGEFWSRASYRASQAPEIGEQFSRQAKLLGKDGQNALGSIRIGIVGAGGIGSAAGQLLVHSGVSTFHLVDFDTIEASNMPRIVGSTPDDVASGAAKIDILRRYILVHNPKADVHVIADPVEDPRCIADLVSMDAIICGTDDTTSRAFLNQLCHQYYVPVLDLGVEFGANGESGKLVKEVGKINLMLPGTPCLICSGDIDPKRLADESLTEEQRVAAGHYVTGVDVEHPSMMVFNMQVAARGIQHLIGWFTGLSALNRDCLEHYRFLGLNGSSGVKAVRKRSEARCLMCSPNAAVLGRGDSTQMLISPRP